MTVKTLYNGDTAKIAICFSKSQNPHFFCVPHLFHNTRFMTIIKLPVDSPFSTEIIMELIVTADDYGYLDSVSSEE